MRCEIKTQLEKAITAIHATPHKVVIEFAGAGVQALAWLHSVGGSSRTILEATDRYASASLIEAINFEPEQFVSSAVAEALATTAYRRAKTLLVDDAAPVAGIGCTATIATDRLKQGQHRCCIALRTPDSLTTYSLVLTKGERTRQEEEEVVSLLMIDVIADWCGPMPVPKPDLLASETVQREKKPVTPLQQLAADEVAWVKIDPTGRLTSGETLPGIALLSGAFNPLHEGHRRMVQVASKIVRQEVFFELAGVNADKGAISLPEIQRRMAQFEGWATVVLSRSPLFHQKARLFPKSVFVIGVDTAERILQPRFYHHNSAEMFASLDVIREAGCRFLVAGRLKENNCFLSLADIDVPSAYEDLFEAIPEKEFRVDISSTKIRQNQTIRIKEDHLQWLKK